MAYTHTIHAPGGGTLQTSDDAFAATFTSVIADYEQSKSEWLAKLSKEGVKMVHPDDGHVNRQRDSISPSYPHFGWHTEPGDVIVLGDAKKYRYCLVIEAKPWRFQMDPTRRTYEYYFREFCPLGLPE